jgi:sialic acid synthase SpsE
MNLGPYNLETEPLIVAEIGNNHEGNPEVAAEMVRAAAKAGAHGVKFQTFRTDHFVRPTDEARYLRMRGFELTIPQFADLARLAHSLGLLFLSTPLDLPSADGLVSMVDAFKIASGDITFYPLLDRVLASGKPIVLSTGASDLDQVVGTVDYLKARGAGDRLCVLHCVSSYPAPPEQANLLAIPTLARCLGVPVGYSDHTLGDDAAVLAVALGACFIEKHFTLDTAYSDFRDHQLSATPAALAALIERVRQTRLLLGAPEKRVMPCEAEMTHAIRRSVVAAHDLPAGHRVTAADLNWMRPAGGLAPGCEAALLGQTLGRAVGRADALTEADLSTPQPVH